MRVSINGVVREIENILSCNWDIVIFVFKGVGSDVVVFFGDEEFSG